MASTTQEPGSAEVATFAFEPRAPAARRAGPVRRVGRGVASLLLGGLTTMEIIAGAVAVISVTLLLWATDTVSPERLVTGAGFRAAWILLVMALIRPVTWIPYV